MKVTILPGREIRAEHVRAWSEIQADCPECDSPFFRPELMQSVAAVRTDVEVAVVEQDGERVAYLPFQRARGNVGKPLADRLSDFQGVIHRPGFLLDPTELVSRCGLSRWKFDHLVAVQRAFEGHAWSVAQSPYIDISAGFEAYCRNRRDSGSDLLSQALRKGRKIARELGPLRFEPQTYDPRVFDTLVDWKTNQYRQTGQANVFARSWTVDLLRQILQVQSISFAGMLSALYAGDALIAVHLGMRSHHVLHYWFPAYNLRLSQYSPGLVLFAELARMAASLGIRRIDLGKGDERYKSSLMTGETPLYEGSVESRPLAWKWKLGRNWRRTRRWIRRSPLHGPARLSARVLRPLSDWFAFR